MSTDALGYGLFLLVCAVSFIAVRYRNVLITLGAAILWATLLSFILANTTHSNFQEIFILGIVAFMCAFALIGFFTRSKGERSFAENIGGLVSREKEERPNRVAKRGLMDLSSAEYRNYINSRTRMRRRR